MKPGYTLRAPKTAHMPAAFASARANGYFSDIEQCVTRDSDFDDVMSEHQRRLQHSSSGSTGGGAAAGRGDRPQPQQLHSKAATPSIRKYSDDVTSVFFLYITDDCSLMLDCVCVLCRYVTVVTRRVRSTHRLAGKTRHVVVAIAFQA